VFSSGSEHEATRLFPGRETGERLGLDVQGQRHTPVATGLAPMDIPSYAQHDRAYLKLLPPASSAPSADRHRRARAPLLSVLLGSGSSMPKSEHVTYWPCGQTH